MINIVTNDSRLDLAVAEILGEIRNSQRLEGSFVAERIEKGLYVKKDADGGRIGYCDTRALLRAVSLLAEYADSEELDLREVPRYDTLGSMPDMSRNAVMKVESVKKLMRITAMAGYNAMMLYTEDTYEIEGYPYFGHLRGRYSAAELREMDDYADLLGIELIPCIQTLAHLNAFLEWPMTQGFRDCDDIMLAGDDRVYALVDKMLETMSKNLRSKRINLGLDEAHMLGCGKYLDRNGYVKRSEIMKAHLARVTELCKKHGYEPRMWSDMFFRMTNNGVYRVIGHNVPDYIVESVPPEITLVYWEYIQTRRENYNDMFRQHKAFNNKVAFAGGDASWYGLVPLNMLASKSSLAAVKSIEDNGVGEIYVTMWGDDGSSCSFFSTLTTLFIYSEACWGDADGCEARSQRRIEALTGLDPKALIELELVNALPGREKLGEASVNPTKYMFYSNILMGKFDLHVPKGSGEHFAEQAERWHREAEAAQECGYGYIFRSVATLCDVLALKAEMGIRLHDAYKAGDRAMVARICREEIPELEARTVIFHNTLREQWLCENKSFGFDVIDLRIGGMIGQLRSAVILLERWLSGEVDTVEELEAPRIEYVARCGYGYDNGVLLANRWQYIAGQNVSNMFGV